MECSGLIKLTADGGALFAGHATFNMFSYMLRVFKHYTYNIRSFPTAAQTVSFSSRPADLESKVTSGPSRVSPSRNADESCAATVMALGDRTTSICSTAGW